MTSLPTTKRCSLSPSQPSPVGASAYACTGPTRSGCGLRGTHPLSPSPEVQRSMANVDKCGVRQRSRADRRMDTVSSLRFVLFRQISNSVLGSCAPCQYYGGQNATAHPLTSKPTRTQGHHEERINQKYAPNTIGCTLGCIFACYIGAMKEKARCQIRLDPNVHERLKSLAAQSDLSLNQLLEGILAWSANNAHSGYPRPREDPPLVDTHPMSNVVWFGHDGILRDPNGKATELADEPSQICFLLDFRPSRASVNGWEVEDVE